MASKTDPEVQVKALLTKATKIVRDASPMAEPDPVLVAAVLQALIAYHPKPALIPR